MFQSTGPFFSPEKECPVPINLTAIASWQRRQTPPPFLSLLSTVPIAAGSTGEGIVYNFNQPITLNSQPNNPNVQGINGLGSTYASFFGGGTWVQTGPSQLTYQHTRQAPSPYGRFGNSFLGGLITAVSGAPADTSFVSVAAYAVEPTFDFVSGPANAVVAGTTAPLVFEFNSEPNLDSLPTPVPGTWAADTTGSTAHFYTRFSFTPASAWVAGPVQFDWDAPTRRADGLQMSGAGVQTVTVT